MTAVTAVRPSAQTMASTLTTPRLSRARASARGVDMETNRTATPEAPTYAAPPTADERPPAGPATVTYRWATFGTERVMVAGDLLAELEER